MVVKYFECSFSKIYPPKFGLNTPWLLEEPSPYPCEKGVWNWVNVRDSTAFPNGGTIKLIPDPSDLSRACAEFIMDKQGTRPLLNPDGTPGPDQHTKLYEVQERQAFNYVGVEVNKEEYFNLNYFAPADIVVRNWRMLWQMNGEAGVYGQDPPIGTPGPQLALYFYAPQYGGQLMFVINRFYYADNVDREFALMPVSAFPKNRWVPITVYMKQGSSFRSLDGTVIIWIDNVKVFERHDLPTATKSGTPYEIWSIANYGGPEEEYGQTMYFKDIIVANERITTPVGLTHTLTLASTPINGVPILVNGTQHVTPSTAVVGETPTTVISTPSSFTQAGVEYVFDHWEDGSTNSTRSISVLSDMTLTATYKTMMYTLTVLSSQGGTTNPPPGILTLNAGVVQPVVPIPNTGYKHIHWILDGALQDQYYPAGSTISITINADHTVQAVFEVSAVAIQVISGGNGTVSPTGSQTLTIGQSYQFAAIPNTGYKFDHWDLAGANLGSTNPLSLVADATMNGKTLTAIFTTIPPVQISMNIATQGNGTVNLTNGPHTFNVGDSVTFIATPATYNAFNQWTQNGTIHTKSPVTIQITQVMDGQTLTAIFIRITRTLTISSTANGTTNPAPATYEAAVNSLVQVSAIPYSGYMLDHWELDGVGVGDAIPYSVTMSTDHTLLAVFVVAPPPPPGKHNLTITATTGGTTNPALGVWEYNEGMSALVQAKPDNDYSFDHWELDGVISKDNPVTVIMNTDHTLHAVFKEKPVPISLWKVATVATTLIAVGGIGAAAR